MSPMLSIKEPESMEEIIYFTQRAIGAGKVRCWVFKQDCPKCKGALMGKPVEKGKIKVRAKNYICPKCNYSVEKQQYEDSLTANIHYVCPSCSFSGYAQIPFKRKMVQGISTLQSSCEKCNTKIDITKKMKIKSEAKDVPEEE